MSSGGYGGPAALRVVLSWVCVIGATTATLALDHQTVVDRIGVPLAEEWVKTQHAQRVWLAARPQEALDKLLAQLSKATRVGDSSYWRVVAYNATTDDSAIKEAYALNFGLGVIIVNQTITEPLTTNPGRAAFLLAHEMAHCLNGDGLSLPWWKQKLGLSDTELLQAAQSSPAATIARTGATVGGSGRAGQDDTISERAADVGGVFILRRAGLPLKGACDYYSDGVVQGLLNRLDGTDYNSRDRDVEAAARTDEAFRSGEYAPCFVGVRCDAGASLEFVRPIKLCWSANQGASVVGWPTTNGTGGVFVHQWGSGLAQDFVSDTGEASCILLRAGARDAYWVHGAIWAEFAATGGVDKYGFAKSGEYDVQEGRAQDFENGTLVWNRQTNRTALRDPSQTAPTPTALGQQDFSDIERIARFVGYTSYGTRDRLLQPCQYVPRGSGAGSQPYVAFVVRDGRVEHLRSFSYSVDGKEFQFADDGDGFMIVTDFRGGERLAPVVDGRRCPEVVVTPGQGIWYPVDAKAMAAQEPSTNASDADRYYVLGKTLLDAKRYEEALVLFDKALGADDRHASAWCDKGYTLGKLGRPQEALQCYDTALAINPRFAIAMSNKGMLLSDMGRPQEALTLLDRAVSIDAHNAYAWSNRGCALRALGRLLEAVQSFDRALELDKAIAGVWSNKGVALDDMGRHQEALALHEHALSIDPRYAFAWNGKGCALFALGRYAEARSAFGRARALGYPDAQKSLTIMDQKGL